MPVGAARDGDAAKAQKDASAAKAYEALMRATGGDQAAGLTKLGDKELQALSRYAYSSKTSDPDVVRARVKVANEMAKRGMDVKAYGAKGGGVTAKKREKAKTTRASGAMELTGVREQDGTWRFDTDPAAPEQTTTPLDGDAESATVAAAIPVKPPAAWFDDPGLSEPTALTVTADGRVYGHAAAWGVRHIGLPGCRTAPRSQSGYRYFRTGQVETADGAMVATGRITLGTGHADLNGNLTAASEHYDHTGSAVADVATGEDAHGIWFAGALRPEVSPAQVRTLRASSLSGDWRPAGRNLEMVGLLAVNVPGFPTPRASIAASGAEVAALVAAGVITRTPQESVVAAPAPPPPADDKPAPAPDGAPQPGDMVSIGDTGLHGEVVEADEDGVHVEVVCDPSDLTPATPEDAVAASAVVRAMRRDLDGAVRELRGMRAEKILAAVPE